MYNSRQYKLGRCLKRGKGIFKVLDICYKNGWSDENTHLIVKNSTDLNSWWSIYEKIYIEEEN